MARIRRKTFNELMTEVDAHGTNSNIVRAVALSVFVKHHVKSSCIKDFSLYKLHKLTNLHYQTLRRRLKDLAKLGMIEWLGKSKSTLRFKRIASRNARNNIVLDHLVYDTVKDVERSLYAQFVVEIQLQKDFVKQVVKSRNNPKSQKEFEVANKLSKHYRIDKREYREFGISYKTVARRLRVGMQKAVAIVRYAIRNRFLKVVARKRWVIDKLRGAMNLAVFDDCGTFVMSNCVVNVKANVYAVGSRVPKPLGNPLMALLNDEK